MLTSHRALPHSGQYSSPILMTWPQWLTAYPGGLPAQREDGHPFNELTRVTLLLYSITAMPNLRSWVQPSISETDWLSKVLRPNRHKIGQFGDVLPSQSLGLVVKKIKPNKTNLICRKPKWSKLTWKHTKLQRKPLRKYTKTNLNLTKCKFKNCSHLCAYTCAQLLYTAPHEAHSSYDNIQPLPPDNQHSSDAIEEGVRQELWHLQ